MGDTKKKLKRKSQQGLWKRKIQECKNKLNNQENVRLHKFSKSDRERQKNGYRI
jgi:hypothetical protein